MTAEIARIENTTSAAQLERIAASGLLRAGSVNTIELVAVKRELGEKWPRRREHIWAHTENVLKSAIDEGDDFIRLTETSYLISLSQLAGPAAQTKCARILRDLLNFFLGSSAHADIVVRNVTFLEGDQIRTTAVCLDVDTLTVQAALPTTPIQQRAFSPRRAAASSIASCAGPLNVTFDIEHLYRIREYALAARRIKVNVTDGILRRTVSPERLNQLETAALTAIDIETLAFARQVLAEPENANIGLFIPMNIQTLGNSRGRARMLEMLADLPEQSGQRVVIELVNLLRGTPSGAVSEAVACLRARVRGVFARMTLSVSGFQALRGTHLLGTIMEVPPGSFSNTLASTILAFGETARAIAPALVAGPLPNEDFMDICAVAGVTHVTFQPSHVPLAAMEERKRDAQVKAPEDHHQLVYVSQSRVSSDSDFPGVLRDIGDRAAARNRERYVTGLLMHYNGWFLQVLEGARRDVSETLKRIMLDPRHENLQVLCAGPTAERQFPRWNMASFDLPKGHQALVDSLGPTERLDALEISPAQAITLLRAVSHLKDDEDRAAA